jgi:broad specificity phosphatase PhoE
MKRIALFLLLVLVSTSMAAQGVTTVILVRHAEKIADEGDPLLSEAGTARANELARVLADARVIAIYTTQFKRTQNTATPLATALGVTPKVMQAGKTTTYAADVVRDVLQHHAGKTVLVIGHSNSTVDVLRELGVKELPTIPETQYDDLFVVTLANNAMPKLVALRYGQVKR